MNVRITVWFFDRCSVGIKYKSIEDAISDSAWEVWSDEMIKHGWKDENLQPCGNESKFQSLCKVNHMKILTLDEFMSVAKSIPNFDINTATAFIEECLSMYD